MILKTERYVDQSKRWPQDGRHILAHHDADTVVVYQAYRPSTGLDAIKNGTFNVDFSYARMSWIKPNFLWMMYRSGWGTKEGQETVLGLRLRRTFFDRVLAQAVASSFEQSGSTQHTDWKSALETSEVRLQWDPDHAPDGRGVARRAIQLGLRGGTLAAFGKKELLEVIDMRAFVAEQRELAQAGTIDQLLIPCEHVYRPADAATAHRIKLD
jgi:Domain of unknown function (DUF4291)